MDRTVTVEMQWVLMALLLAWLIIGLIVADFAVNGFKWAHGPVARPSGPQVDRVPRGEAEGGEEAVSAFTVEINCVHCGADVEIETQRTLADRETVASVCCKGCSRRAKIDVAWIDIPMPRSEERKALRAKVKQQSLL
jgi:hypothetical protein